MNGYDYLAAHQGQAWTLIIGGIVVLIVWAGTLSRKS